MFGLNTMRKRLFEYHGFAIPFELAPPKPVKTAQMGRLANRGEFVTIAGKGGRAGVKAQWADAMKIEWMTTNELAQAIPPAYTEYIGAQLMRALGVGA